DVEAGIEPVQLSASAILATETAGAFDKEGTIVFDKTEGQNGTPYILYTDYNDQGKPSVRTKRLVFANRDACAEANLPCATNQPGVPVRADQNVRIVGTVKDELVQVSEVYVI
ncbi:MAG: hypothetical protein Q8O19_01080, partial [Rectinemataceae bacterium]|nr:hypothetical protein [Rectinemataceae bacterium]